MFRPRKSIRPLSPVPVGVVKGVIVPVTTGMTVAVALANRSPITHQNTNANAEVRKVMTRTFDKLHPSK